MNNKLCSTAWVLAALLLLCASPVFSIPGDLLGTVTLPGNNSSVGGTLVPVAGGVVYIAPRDFFGNVLDVYTPPVGGNGAAALTATKTVVDAGNAPVAVSAVAWDAKRGLLWGALGNNVYQIALGDPTMSGNSLATFQFNPGVGGISLIDGLAWDAERDTLWYSPDVNLNVYEFGLGDNDPLGMLLSTVAPMDAGGNTDGLVSGVVVGSANTLYIGRNGAAEIRRVNRDTGAFISQFATTSGRVEDLTCDPVTYAPLEAVLAKDAFSGLYEAFEVEEGTCPLAGLEIEVPFDIKPTSCRNPLNVGSRGILPAAILGTDDFDVTQIDIATLALEGVAPVRSAFQDVATPFEPFIGKEDAFDCTDEGPDGFLDLTLKFPKQDVVAALGPVNDGDVVVLQVTGQLLAEFGGTPIVGEDVVVIISK